MMAYAVRRLVLIPMAFFATFLLAFTLVRAAPVPDSDDPSALIGVDRCDRHGSFVPQLLESFSHWVQLRPDPCTGFASDDGAVVPRVRAALVPTLRLSGIAMGLAVLLGLLLGTLLARGGARAQRGVGLVLAVCESVPAFVVAPSLLWLFGLALRLVPPVQPGGDSGAAAVLALAFSFVATHARVVRDGLLSPNTLSYRRAALARGASPAAARFASVRLASLPVFSALGATSSSLLMSAVAVEVVFGIPGLGTLVVHAAQRSDVHSLLGGALGYAALLLVASALFDVAYAAVDPRVRGGR